MFCVHDQSNLQVPKALSSRNKITSGVGRSHSNAQLGSARPTASDKSDSDAIITHPLQSCLADRANRSDALSSTNRVDEAVDSLATCNVVADQGKRNCFVRPDLTIMKAIALCVPHRRRNYCWSDCCSTADAARSIRSSDVSR